MVRVYAWDLPGIVGDGLQWDLGSGSGSDGWPVCEEWVDRWAEGEGKGGV
jgi:hypothetical protein